jgi:hypothetical protein
VLALCLCVGLGLLFALQSSLLAQGAAVSGVVALGVYLNRSGRFGSRRVLGAYAILALFTYFASLSALGSLLDAGSRSLVFYAVLALVAVAVAATAVYIRRCGGLARAGSEFVFVAWAYALSAFPAVGAVGAVFCSGLELVLPRLAAFGFVPAALLVAAGGVYLRRSRGAAGAKTERALYWVGGMASIVPLCLYLFNHYQWSFLGKGGHDASGLLLGAAVIAAGVRMMLVDLRRDEAGHGVATPAA